MGLGWLQLYHCNQHEQRYGCHRMWRSSATSGCCSCRHVSVLLAASPGSRHHVRAKTAAAVVYFGVITVCLGWLLLSWSQSAHGVDTTMHMHGTACHQRARAACMHACEKRMAGFSMPLLRCCEQRCCMGLQAALALVPATPALPDCSLRPSPVPWTCTYRCRLLMRCS